ncbi:MAG: hypothetical protein ABIJ43_00340 [Candidatus Beckwithbacteria bacterium]|nr:hypothetical protein [Patescibacteria group bacterium]
MKNKLIKWLGLSLLIVFMGAVVVQVKDDRTVAEKAFKIGERVVNTADTNFGNIRVYLLGKASR